MELNSIQPEHEHWVLVADLNKDTKQGRQTFSRNCKPSVNRRIIHRTDFQHGLRVTEYHTMQSCLTKKKITLLAGIFFTGISVVMCLFNSLGKKS